MGVRSNFRGGGGKPKKVLHIEKRVGKRPPLGKSIVLYRRVIY